MPVVMVVTANVSARMPALAVVWVIVAIRCRSVIIVVATPMGGVVSMRVVLGVVIRGGDLVGWVRVRTCHVSLRRRHCRRCWWSWRGVR